jgi:hypothetical protein
MPLHVTANTMRVCLDAYPLVFPTPVSANTAEATESFDSAKVMRTVLQQNVQYHTIWKSSTAIKIWHALLDTQCQTRTSRTIRH